jgi:hypothetical protein
MARRASEIGPTYAPPDFTESGESTVNDTNNTSVHRSHRRHFLQDPATVAEAPTFESWKQLPIKLRSRSSWERVGRKVMARQRPAGYVVDPRFLEDDEELEGKHVLNISDDLVLVSDYRSSLFTIDQTRPYRPSRQTQLTWDFQDIFLAHACRDNWILQTSETGWSTIHSARNSLFTTGVLASSTIRSHLNHRCVVGVKNHDGWTRFVILDLDFHSRNREVFLRMAEILLTTFRGDTWHGVVKQEEVSGLHLIRVFSKAVNLRETVLDLRQKLLELDEKHPSLAAEAKASGMPTFGEIEIYPSRLGNPIEQQPPELIGLDATRSWRCRRAPIHAQGRICLVGADRP